MTALTIGIDIGGTSVRASVVDDKGAMLDSAARGHPADGRRARTLARQAGGRTGVAMGGQGGRLIAGFLTPGTDRSSGSAPHLPWREAAVAADMSARIGLPVFTEHDADAAAVAEFRYGAAARGHNSLVLAIGTGIGAA